MRLYDEPDFVGYRLSLRVFDGVHAYGILLMPKDIKPGERRPVVFAQHGFGDKPEDALGVTEDDPGRRSCIRGSGANWSGVVTSCLRL